MGHHTVLNSGQFIRRESGQALVMVTLALIAMCGVLGLAVDFGWAYFVKRAAQTAADAAAIAAAEEMRRMVGFAGPYPCFNGGTCRTEGSPFVCGPSVANDNTDNLDNACLYAQQNGFQEAGRQGVRIVEGSDSAAPTRPGVTLQYWVTVRVTESVPQLFAAMTGNPFALVSARATAGLYPSKLEGSIILLNRNNDTTSITGTGTNMSVHGGGSVVAGSGILMASGCAGAGGCGGSYAGNLQGASTVTAPYTYIRGSGGVDNPAHWTATPQNGFPEGSAFQDPTRRKPQIPVSNAGLPNCEIDGGVIRSTSGGAVQLGPGNYYATARRKDGTVYATGMPIQIDGNVNFRSSGNCLSGVSNASGFSTYVIYGGFDVQKGSNVTFEPGKIVMAGAAEGNPVFDLTIGGGAMSMLGPGSSSAGNVFVFTDPNYPGLSTPANLSSIIGTLKQGPAGFKSGGNDKITISLDGLNQNAAGFPSELKPYNSVVIWQDRRNSMVSYNADGTYNCTDPAMLNCTKSTAEATADGVTTGSPGMSLAAGIVTGIRGTIYQPRGGWVDLQGGPGMTSTVQLISGAINVQGSGTITLLPVTNTMPISTVGLVE